MSRQIFKNEVNFKPYITTLSRKAHPWPTCVIEHDTLLLLPTGPGVESPTNCITSHIAFLQSLYRPLFKNLSMPSTQLLIFYPTLVSKSCLTRCQQLV